MSYLTVAMVHRVETYPGRRRRGFGWEGRRDRGRLHRRSSHRSAFPGSVVLTFGFAVILVTTGIAQEVTREPAGLQGSTYLPLRHWAYDYINVLVARGRLTDLPPLVQPYRRLDVARSLLAAGKAGRFTDGERGWVDALKREFAYEVGLLGGRPGKEVYISAELGLGIDAVSQKHRDPLRPVGDGSLWATIEAYFRGEAPLVAGAFGARWDAHYLNDPQFPKGRAVEMRACDPIIDECAYRVEDAYVEVQAPYVRLFFGRMYRNWGIPSQDGLLLSDYNYSYDHLGYRFGSQRIALTGLFTPLNDFRGDTARYFSSHRFDWQIRDNLVLALGESVVWGGENRRVEFAFVNPVGLWEVSGIGTGRERNALGLAELWWRPFSGLVTYGAFLVDNTSVGDEEQGKGTGFNQYAAAFGVQLPSLIPTMSLRADFTVVSSLAYRSRIDFFEYYMFRNIGLAQDKTDDILVTLMADWFVRRGLVLKPGLELMWRGEDDLRAPWPDDAFTGHDPLLVGTVETTIRPVIDGRWVVESGLLPWDLWVDTIWDLGINFVKNRRNQPAGWDAEIVGSLLVTVRRRFQ